MVRRLLLALVALLLLLGVVVGGGLWWLGTDAGLRFIVAKAQETMTGGGNRLELEGASGSLYHGVRFDRFEWQGNDGLRASGTGLVGRWSLMALLKRQLSIPELSADTVIVKLAPAAPEVKPREATPMPGSFALPINVDLQRLAIADLRITPDGTAEPIVVRDIMARLAYRDAVFRLEQVAAVSPYGSIVNGHIELADKPPHALGVDVTLQGSVEQIPFDLHLTANGDLDRLSASTTGEAGGARIDLDAKLSPLAVMPLMSANGNLANLDLKQVLQSAPQTLIDAELTLAPQGIDGWSGSVKLRNTADGTWSDGKLPLLGLDANLAVLDAGDAVNRQVQVRGLELTLSGVTAQSGEGRITGSIDAFPGRTRAIAETQVPQVKAELAFDSIDVAQFAAQLPPTALSGKLTLDDGTFELALAQSEQRMRALLPTVLPATIAGASGAAEVTIRGHFDETKLELQEARVRLGQTRLDASGEAGFTPPYRIALNGNAQKIDLAQWLPRDAGIDERWRNARISGAWSVDGKVVPGLDAAFTLKLADSTLAGKPLAAAIDSRVVLAEDWSPVRLEKTSAEIRFGNNKLAAKGSLGRSGDKLVLDASLTEPQLLDPRLGGRLLLNGNLSGTFDRLRAQLNLSGDRLSLEQPDGAMRIGSVRIEASAPATAALPPQAPLDLSIRLRALQVAGRKLDALDLKANGTLATHRFDLALTGEGQTAKMRGDGHATLGDAPAWRARLLSTTVDGAVPVRMTAPADIRVDAGSLRIDRFNVSVAGGEARLERMALDWRETLIFDSRGSATGLPVTRLLDLAIPPKDAGAGGSAGSDPALEALRAVRLDASWNLTGTGAEDLDGQIRVALREVAGEKPGKTEKATKLGLSGDNGVRVTLKRGRLDGRFDLDLPSLAFTHRLTMPDLVINGRLQLGGSVGGTVLRPLWDAKLTGDELSVLQRSVGWRLNDGVLAAQLDGRKLKLQKLRFASRDGSIALSGEANLLDSPRRAASGGDDKASTLPIDGRFELEASKFQVPIGPGQRVALSGTTILTSDADGLSLRGRMKVDEGIIEIQGSSAPALPSDVKVIRASEATGVGTGTINSDAADSDTKSKSPIRILTDLAIDLGERLRVTGNGLAARLTGNLKVLGTLPDDPKLTGVVNVVDGSYQAYGQDLRIENGKIRFNGPIDNPSLDIVAKRPFLPVEVGVAVTGNALNPTIALVSTPDMSETDKLSWLVLGTDPANAQSAAQSLALRQAAQSLLVKDDGSYKPGIAERLGLDVLSFGYGSDTGPAQGITESKNPTGLPGGQSSTASAAQQEVVTLGKRIGSKLFVSYEAGVRGIYNLLRIQYSLSKRLSVRAQSGSDNAVDLMYSFSFD